MSSDPQGSPRQLPERPDLRHLKDQAKDLLKAGQATSLAKAQFQVARQYGFASWPKLKAHVESLQTAGQLKQAIDANDLERVKELMTRHPELHRAPLGYGKNGPLTWVAECRVPRVPPGETRLAMARWMIENGSDVHQGGDGPLMRAALDDSRIPMMELLVAHGADVNAVWGGHYPVILGPCETFAPRALKWLLDHGADLHAAAKYSSPVGMIICIYSRSAKGKNECLEIVGGGRLRPPGHAGDGAAPRAARPAPGAPRPRPVAPGPPLHVRRGLRRRERRRAGRCLSRDARVGRHAPAPGARVRRHRRGALADRARGGCERPGGPGDGHTPLFHTVVNLASGMGHYDDSKARLLLDHGADPNARATFPPEATFHSEAATEPLHDVTPVGYARRYPDRRFLNEAAIAAIEERGGTE